MSEDTPRRRSEDIDTSEQSMILVQLASLSGRIDGYRELSEHRLTNVERQVDVLDGAVRDLHTQQQQRLGRDAGIALTAGIVATVLGIVFQLG